MKHNYYGSYGNVELKPLVEDNIEYLRVWRNNLEETKFLRPIGTITPEMQKKWFESYLENKQDIVFGIYETNELNRLVGSLAIYDILDGRAEIGKIQIGDPDAHGKGIGRISLVIAMKIGFELLGLNEIYASVHQENISARSNDLKIGFKIVGNHPSCVGGLEDEIIINKEQLYSANDYCADIKIYKGDETCG